MTAATNWSESDSKKAQAVWFEYQAKHDLSDRIGQTVGIEPASGRLWFGDSIQDVVEKRTADGSLLPLFFVRVGAATYYRKGGHR
jgi:hypothetical protein